MPNPDLLSFTPDGVQHAWDATSLSNYAKCPRYYQYVNIEGWQPVVKSPHLVFGGHYATALERYYKLRATGSSPDDACRTVVREALVATWEYDPDHPEGGAPWESLHNTKTRYTLIRSIVWYLEEFGENDNTEIIHLDDGTPAAELSFSLELAPDITYCGHMDRMVTFGEDSYVMDQKTSGSTITPRFFDQFTPDFQMSGYAYAGRVLFNQPITGVIIDAAQIAVGFTNFTRGFVHRSLPVLEDWRENSIALIRQAQAASESGHYPQNFASCGNYGGCAFRKVCSRAPEHRRRALDASFVQRERWDPLKRR